MGRPLDRIVANEVAAAIDDLGVKKLLFIEEGGQDEVISQEVRIISRTEKFAAYDTKKIQALIE